MTPPDALEIAEAFIQAGELQDALEYLNKHIEEKGANDAALRLRAAVMARLSGRYRDALDDLDALTQQQPDDYILRAVLLELSGQPEAALQASADGHAAHPHSDRMTEHYLYLLRRQGEFERASAVIAELPESWRWSQWAGDLSVDRGEDKDAIIHYDAAIQTLQVRYYLSDSKAAYILEDEGISDAASLTIPAVYARLLLARAHCLRRLGHYSAAEADYERAQTLIPDDPAIPFNRGLVAFHMGDTVQAKGLIEGALREANPMLKAEMQDVLKLDSYAGLLSLK